MMQDRKGFFGSLFDLSFTSLVTTRIIKVLYVLAIIVIGIYALIFIAGGFSNSTSAGGDNRVVSDHGEHQRAPRTCKCSGVVKGTLRRPSSATERSVVSAGARNEPAAPRLAGGILRPGGEHNETGRSTWGCG
jgi:hypothetical protein